MMLANLEADPFGPLSILAIAPGLRQGELLGPPMAGH
jgi:hypothetical protein